MTEKSEIEPVDELTFESIEKQYVEALREARAAQVRVQAFGNEWMRLQCHELLNTPGSSMQYCNRPKGHSGMCRHRNSSEIGTNL
jgi:hypothetical protein